MVHNWSIKGCGMSCLWTSGIKDPLLLIRKSSLCGDSGLCLKKYVIMAICLMSNHQWYETQCALEASLNETNFPFFHHPPPPKRNMPPWVYCTMSMNIVLIAWPIWYNYTILPYNMNTMCIIHDMCEWHSLNMIFIFIHTITWHGRHTMLIFYSIWHAYHVLYADKNIMYTMYRVYEYHIHTQYTMVILYVIYIYASSSISWASCV